MKKLFTFLFLAFASFAYSAEPQDEVAKVDLLIAATEENLHRLKALRVLMIEYKQAELKAVKDPKDTDNLLKLVTDAKKIHEIISESQLQEYFSPQFLEEIKKFSQVADKKNIPQAK